MKVEPSSMWEKKMCDMSAVDGALEKSLQAVMTVADDSFCLILGAVLLHDPHLFLLRLSAIPLHKSGNKNQSFRVQGCGMQALKNKSQKIKSFI
jgi:hypothetical protein